MARTQCDLQGLRAAGKKVGASATQSEKLNSANNCSSVEGDSEP